VCTTDGPEGGVTGPGFEGPVDWSVFTTDGPEGGATGPGFEGPVDWSVFTTDGPEGGATGPGFEGPVDWSVFTTDGPEGGATGPGFEGPVDWSVCTTDASGAASREISRVSACSAFPKHGRTGGALISNIKCTKEGTTTSAFLDSAGSGKSSV
jgi:hypothetical protein